MMEELVGEPKTIPSPGHDSCAVENHNTKSHVTDLWKSLKKSTCNDFLSLIITCCIF